MLGNQNETIAFLSSLEAFGGDGATASTIVTHISTVLLLDERAIKLKRAVHLPYVDFSTPERRLAACLQELKLNRRTAPGIYRAVHRITRESDGRLALNGYGTLVDAVVEMMRFDDSQLLDRLAREDRLPTGLMERLAHQIAALHQTAEVVACEGATRLAKVLDGNERMLVLTSAFLPDEVASVTAACRDALERHADLLDRRAQSGRVRRCHGDLHLRNICLLDGTPTLFDCLEFDEELATTDVLYDLAFVLMDLWHRKLTVHANVLFNRYLDATGDDDGLALLPFFMAVRAVISAHITASETANTDFASAWQRAEARAYLDMARALLAPSPCLLVAVGGFSGSGKSTVAMHVAPEIGPAPGARVLSSDRIRKRLFGVAPEQRLPVEGYLPAISDKVYSSIIDQAATVIAQGHAVVADAVFDRAPERERLAAVALRSRVPFRALWLDAPADVLMRRVAARKGDPSDATPDVVMDQISRQSAPRDWLTLCAQAELDTVVDAVRFAIRPPLSRGHLAGNCPKTRIPSVPPRVLNCSRALARGIAQPHEPNIPDTQAGLNS